VLTAMHHGPVSVIHIDADDDSDDVDQSLQPTNDDSQLVNIIDDSGRDVLVGTVSVLLPHMSVITGLL